MTNSSPTHLSRALRRGATSGLAAAVTALALTAAVAGATPAAAAPVAAHAETDAVENLGLQIGADATSRTIVWQSANPLQLGQLAQVVPVTDLVDGQVPDDAPTIEPDSGLSSLGGLWHEATVTGLTPGEWAYRVGTPGAWTATYRFTVRSLDAPWSFIAVGDAQLGAGDDLDSDAAGWQQTLGAATAADPDAVFISSLGDQVEWAFSTDEYSAFFTPDELRRTPFAVVDGNHDFYMPLYSDAFAHPNASSLGRPLTQSVGDYWYTIGNVLFLSLDSNALINSQHVQFLNETIGAHGGDADWIVVQFHHSIYSVGPHFDDVNVLALRDALSPTMSELGVDLVLMGHDHTYARSQLMSGTTATSGPGAAGDELEPADDEVLYVTLNSSSGSKYYGLRDPQPDYVALQDQGRTPTYSVVDVAPERLTISTFRSQTGELVDEVSLLATDDAAGPDPVTPDEPDDSGDPVVPGGPQPAPSPVGGGESTVVTAPAPSVDSPSTTRPASTDPGGASTGPLPATGAQTSAALLALGLALVSLGLTVRLRGARQSSSSWISSQRSS